MGRVDLADFFDVSRDGSYRGFVLENQARCLVLEVARGDFSLRRMDRYTRENSRGSQERHWREDSIYQGLCYMWREEVSGLVIRF